MRTKKHYFLANRLFLLMLLFYLAGMGCASKSKQQLPEPLPHSHYYPFTEVIGEYHLRLIVDHREGNMALVFEDFAERPVKPVKYDSINGKITFPDGTVKEEKFIAKINLCSRYCRRYYSRKYGFPRQRGVFTSEAKWLKTTPTFNLEVTVPFNGKDYALTFQYEALGGKIPYHRK